MADVPANPKIYHITHCRNLPHLVSVGAIWSDAKRIQLGDEVELVGMPNIKRRRLEECVVDCHPDT